MNDRFKLRFWYKPKNRYINTEKLVLNDGTYTQVGTKQMNNGTYCSYIVNEYNSSDVIPEQCTGLKDKNGKLIYEGDIVHSSLDGGTQKVIYWDDGLASFMAYNRYPDKLYTQRIGDGYFIELGFEVIGNIHENADLLENEE